MGKQIPQKSRLGRGLSSLMNLTGTAASAPEADPPTAVATAPLPPSDAQFTPRPSDGTAVLDVRLEDLRPNPHQPRRQFDETSLKELAASLRTTGMIQPVVARPIDGGGFELIAGERRWRAAKVAGLTTLPVILKKVDPVMQAQMALVENLQREDLNPIERANAYKALLDNLGLTQAELADRLGEDRSVIGHHMRLLELAPRVQAMVAEGRLSASHARVLAGVADPLRQEKLAETVVSQGLNIKNLERLIASSGADQPAPTEPAKPPSAHLADLEKSLSRQLGMRIQVKAGRTKGRGRVVIHYASLDQFDDLLGKLGLSSDE